MHGNARTAPADPDSPHSSSRIDLPAIRRALSAALPQRGSPVSSYCQGIGGGGGPTLRLLAGGAARDDGGVKRPPSWRWSGQGLLRMPRHPGDSSRCSSRAS